MVEGARLLSEWTGNRSEGSNPFVSAIDYKRSFYARNGIISKAQNLWAFLLFAIDFLSIKTFRFSLIFLLNIPLSCKTPYSEKRSTEILVMGNQGLGN